MKNLIKSIALGALMSVVMSTNIMAYTVGIQCLNGKHTYTPRTFQMTKAEANEFCATKKTILRLNPALAWTCPLHNNAWYTTDCPFVNTCITFGVGCPGHTNYDLTEQTLSEYGTVDSTYCNQACLVLQSTSAAE